MTRIRLVGLTLVAALALSAVAAATATAALPEVVNNVGNEVVKKGFTIKSEKSTLEAVGGAKVTCTADSGSGKLKGLKEGEATIKFTGCEAALGGKCKTGEGAEGEVIIVFSMSLVYLNRATKEIAFLFSILPSGTTIELKCQKGVTIDLSGSFLVPVGPINKLQLKYSLVAKQEKGVQKPLEYEPTEGVKAKDTLEVEVNGAKKEQAGLAGEEKFTFEEEVEFRA